MSLEKLSPDCLTILFQYLRIIEIQELAITCKKLRSLCLAAQLSKPVVMPMSKAMLPEILLKLTTAIQVNETIQRTGTNWLTVVLNHFSKVKTVDITTKNLPRQVIRDILSACDTSKTVRTVIVPNMELMKWVKSKKLLEVSIRPRQLKNIKQSRINIVNNDFSAEKDAWQTFNEYLAIVATKYNSGIKLNDSYEVLALNNIMILGHNNYFGVDKKSWAGYINQYRLKTIFPKMFKETRSIINTIIKDYQVNNDKLYDIQARYSTETSKEVLLCFDLLTNVDNNKKIRESSNKEKEEDLFMKNYIDAMLLSPLFNSFGENLKVHGNGHPLTESKYRKMKEAKKMGDSTRGCKGRVPDRSLELLITEGVSYHVLVCEVKVSSASRNHPDLSKLGSMLKDVLDYALEQGVSTKYAVTGLLIEGVDCTIYSMSMPCPKLYQMTTVRSFKMPNAPSKLSSTINDIVESIKICQALIHASCFDLQLISNQFDNISTSIVPTCSSPPRYTDFYL